MPKPKEFAKDAAAAFFSVLDTDRDVSSVAVCGGLKGFTWIRGSVCPKLSSVDAHHTTRCPVLRTDPRVEFQRGNSR
jgi:hypothetical protein